ncbi:MAG: hypothetical protein OEY10_00300 [Nitrosopumilus sp.]|nr:hypothetical protein [Nitrosopumilus sp.]
MVTVLQLITLWLCSFIIIVALGASRAPGFSLHIHVRAGENVGKFLIITALLSIYIISDYLIALYYAVFT